MQLITQENLLETKGVLLHEIPVILSIFHVVDQFLSKTKVVLPQMKITTGIPRSNTDLKSLFFQVSFPVLYNLLFKWCNK